MEVSHTAVLIATLAVLVLDAPRLLNAMELIVQGGLERTGDPTALEHSANIAPLATSSLESLGLAVWPIAAAAAVAGVVSNVAQVGFHFSGKALEPSFQKLSPATGFKRMFGKNQLVELGKSLAKVAIVGGLATSAIWSRMSTFGLLVDASPASLISDMARLISSLAFEMVALLAVVAALDLVWQRKRFAKTSRMTKEEVKREARESDLSPELRGQIRRRQNEASRRRMLADVPSADVVIVNPTHYAVALRYDGSKPAPEVIAKGMDYLALTIREIAEQAGVTIVEQPPLARSLYRDVELGATIPEEFFHAVAEVLAFVFRTARRRRHAV